MFERERSNLVVLCNSRGRWLQICPWVFLLIPSPPLDGDDWLIKSFWMGSYAQEEQRIPKEEIIKDSLRDQEQNWAASESGEGGNGEEGFALTREQVRKMKIWAVSIALTIRCCWYLSQIQWATRVLKKPHKFFLWQMTNLEVFIHPAALSLHRYGHQGAWIFSSSFANGPLARHKLHSPLGNKIS